MSYIETMKGGMEHESTAKKFCIAIGSAIHLAFAGGVGIVFAL